MSEPYKIVIGLEVHVQLLTESKLFCGCSTKFGAPPNSQTCPVCIGMPGVLPVMNRRAFELAIKAALALGADIASFTKWDRKNYYYPDLPKAYQISQYDLPFSTGGGVEIETEHGKKTVRLIRVHLEEDAGKNTHSETGGDSLVDLNRTGVPLLEIVSEPDMTHPAEAKAYLETLRTLLRDLDVSDCEMQEGSLRCDANVNIHITKDGKVYKTPVVEIKNMNSISAVERAIKYEAERQYEVWQKDGKVMGSSPKQTRGWDDPRGITKAQREKEEASDYRYFPEPDLVPVVPSQEWIEEIKQSIGENSQQRKERYQKDYGLSEYSANVLVDKGRAVADYFDELVRLKIEPKSAANWIINDVLAHTTGRIKVISDLCIDPVSLSGLIQMVAANKLNLNDAREKVLPEMLKTGKSAETIAQEMGLEVVLDMSAIEALADEVIRDMAKAADDVRNGNMKAIGALVGQVMKRGKGKYPPALVNQVLTKKLTGG
jgi:aspartyl-tRNA(Asn)/glutamyl-tRNA(Gln) amidotransferase subunit B